MVRQGNTAVLRVAVLWHGSILRETLLDRNRGSLGKDGFVEGAHLAGLAPRKDPLFRMDRRLGPVLVATPDLQGWIRRDGRTEPLAAPPVPEGDACKAGAIPLRTGDWGLLFLDPVTLFFQAVPPSRGFFRHLPVLGNGIFTTSLVVSAFVLVASVVTASLAFEPSGTVHGGKAAPRMIKVAASIQARKEPDPLRVREDKPQPPRERIRFGEETKARPRSVVQAPRKPVSVPLPAQMVVQDGAGGEWADDGERAGGFRLEADAAPPPPPPPAVAPPPPPKVDLVGLTQEYLQTVRDELARRKIYPVAAQRLGLTGSVSLSFIVKPDGTFCEVRVKRSSGSELLDQAAMETVLALSGTLRRPALIGEHPLKTSVVLRYELG